MANLERVGWNYFQLLDFDEFDFSCVVSNEIDKLSSEFVFAKSMDLVKLLGLL